MVDGLRGQAEALLRDHTSPPDMPFETAWQLVLRTNSNLEYDVYFYETAGRLVALLICARECALAFDIEVSYLDSDVASP